MKKWIIIVVIALVIVGLVGYFISQGGTPEVGAPGEGKPVTSGTIQVPGGPEIKVVGVGFPEELELKWEKLGMSDFMLNLIGALKNISDQTIRFDELTFLLDGEWIGRWPRFEGKTLGPGEEARFNMGMVGYSKTSEVLEVRVVNFQTIGGSAEAPEEPTPEEPAAPEEPATPEPSIPEPEMTPEEVAMEWYNLTGKGKFSEVIKLYTLSEQQRIESLGGTKALGEAWRERPVIKMEIENRTEIEDSEAWVYALFDYADGTTGDHVSFLFKKVNGQWRIDKRIKKVY